MGGLCWAGFSKVLRIDERNIAATAGTTTLPAHQDTNHLLQFLRTEADTSGMQACAHTRTDTQAIVSPATTIHTDAAGIHIPVDCQPPFHNTLQHIAYWAKRHNDDARKDTLTQKDKHAPATTTCKDAVDTSHRSVAHVLCTSNCCNL